MPLYLVVILLVWYFILCALTAVYGRRTRIGFFGVLFLSTFMTPPVLAFFLFFLRPRVPETKIVGKKAPLPEKEI